MATTERASEGIQDRGKPVAGHEQRGQDPVDAGACPPLGRAHWPSWALRAAGRSALSEEESAPRASLEALSLENPERVLHELRVHQIELEMQNEELRQAQALIDTERARYFDLYDLAPVGYCTLSESGLILQANLEAARLLGTPGGHWSGNRSAASSSRRIRTSTTCTGNSSWKTANRRPANCGC
jgi:PAS domain-containing protein